MTLIRPNDTAFLNDIDSTYRSHERCHHPFRIDKRNRVPWNDISSYSRTEQGQAWPHWSAGTRWKMASPGIVPRDEYCRGVDGRNWEHGSLWSRKEFEGVLIVLFDRELPGGDHNEGCLWRGFLLPNRLLEVYARLTWIVCLSASPVRDHQRRELQMVSHAT